jgi:hypothetical protein
VPTRSIEASQNLESAAPEKGKIKPNALSRRKAPSVVANAKKPAPRPIDPKARQIAAAKTPVKSEDPGGSGSPSRSACSRSSANPTGRASKR